MEKGGEIGEGSERGNGGPFFYAASEGGRGDTDLHQRGKNSAARWRLKRRWPGLA